MIQATRVLLNLILGSALACGIIFSTSSSAAELPDGARTSTAAYFDCSVDNWGSVTGSAHLGLVDGNPSKCIAMSYCGLDSLILSEGTVAEWKAGSRPRNNAIEFLFPPATLDRRCRKDGVWSAIRKYSAGLITFRRSEPFSMLRPLRRGTLRCLKAGRTLFLEFVGDNGSGLMARIPVDRLEFSARNDPSPRDHDQSHCVEVRSRPRLE